ncbi:MAG: LysM peptidoglycan-binding domain-containing protein, partial [Chloroflexi bacterium]|nr:LysM peptidoglycan-binding domain-containing protein [Chloroflexota bacterium]
RYPDYPSSCGEDQSPKVNCVAFHRPEWREAAPYQYRIRSGANAQKYFTFYSVHEAGMYQTVEGLRPGQLLRFTVYLQAWSSGDGSLISSGQDSMNLRVGIDPTGGADPFSPAVGWSAPGDSYDAFAPFSVDAVAESTRVTVFTYSRPVYPLQHNDLYVDDASLTVIGSAAGEATREVIAASGTPPAPGRTPRPTSLPYGQTADYTVQPGDSLAVIAWRFGVSVADIMALNGLPNTVVVVGQVLKVGIAPTPTVTPTATSYLWDTPTPLPDGRAVYIVQPGDTLRLIAWRPPPRPRPRPARAKRPPPPRPPRPRANRPPRRIPRRPPTARLAPGGSGDCCADWQ